MSRLTRCEEGFPSGEWWRTACQCGRCKRCGFDPWVGKIPWRREWQPVPVFLPGKSHGQRSLVGHSLWDHKESDMTEHARMQNVVRRAHDLCGILAPDPWPHSIYVKTSMKPKSRDMLQNSWPVLFKLSTWCSGIYSVNFTVLIIVPCLNKMFTLGERRL